MRPNRFATLLTTLAGLALTACLPDEASDPDPLHQAPRPAYGATLRVDAGRGAADGTVPDDAAVGDAESRDAESGDAAVADAGPTPPAADAGPPPTTRPEACGEAIRFAVGPEGASVTVGAAGGALIDTRVEVPSGALAAQIDLTVSCAGESIVDQQRQVALGPPTRVEADAPTPLGAALRVTLVFDAASLPAGVRPDHLRLYWQPDRYPYVAEPPMLNPVINLRAGTVSVDTPGLGVFQLGYPPDAGEPILRRFSFRAVTGISMGAGAAAYLGTKYPDAFDYIAPLGGPTDWPYLLRYIGERLLGGFCRADSPEGAGAWCGLPPPTEIYEHPSTYEDWFFADSGGAFDRDEYVQIFQDLGYAYGNPFLYNTESPFLPPGMPSSELLRPKGERCAAECRGEDCPPADQLAASTFTIPTGFYDDEYNPDGALPVIAYCDGEGGPTLGLFDDTVAHREPIEVLYAVDVNGNGRRDAFEPVIRDAFEPYADLGCDGVPSALEPGYDPVTAPDPAGDDYDWYRNPNGTEGNALYDGAPDCARVAGGAVDESAAEPYEDVGLDGVADTPQAEAGGYDWGEGNGRFDTNPNFQRFMDRSGGLIFRSLSDGDKARIRVWSDGGIRDIFNFANSTAHMMGRLQGAGQNVRVYDDFPRIMPTSDPVFLPNVTRPDPFGALGQSVLIRYGDPDADAFAIEMGDGAHVGTIPQAINRFMAMFDWLHNRWPTGDWTRIAPPFAREDKIEFFFARRFGKTYRYGISLPPGYGREEYANVRYPVVLLLHGYGQGPEDLPVAGALLAESMSKGAWQKTILVFPEGFCGDADRYQCNDGIDNDGDGYVDSGYDRLRRRACTVTADCNGDYTCRPSRDPALGSFCCSPEWADCGPPEADTCGNGKHGRSEDGAQVTLCSDGVDNDQDGLTDLDDEGCMGDARQDAEADCKQGSFYTTHVARRDGTPGGPDFEAALFDMLDHIDANYRTRRPEMIEVPR